MRRVAGLSRVQELLRCPHCCRDVTVDGAALGCAAGHRFDVARQGYVNLAVDGRHTGAADTAAMVSDRDAFLRAGHFAPVTDLIASVVGALLPRAAPVVADIGAGTGHHLARTLDRLPHSTGLALDLSKYAMRRAARAHGRLGAVLCDVWRELPVKSGTAGVVLDVFAPRNVDEISRILHPDGALVMVTPAPEHLRELVVPFGLLSVDPHKTTRIAETVAGTFDEVDRRRLSFAMQLPPDDVAALVGMGPSAHHVAPHDVHDVDELRRVLSSAQLDTATDGAVAVTAAVELVVYRPAVTG